MNNDRTLKKTFNTKPDGARSVGRPKLQQEDGVDQEKRFTEHKFVCFDFLYKFVLKYFSF